MKEDKRKSKLTKADFVTNQGAMGEKTRKLLKRKKINSPELVNKIMIAPGLWCYPKKPLTTQKEINQFIEQKKALYGIS